MIVTLVHLCELIEHVLGLNSFSNFEVIIFRIKKNSLLAMVNLSFKIQSLCHLLMVHHDMHIHFDTIYGVEGEFGLVGMNIGTSIV